MSYVYNAELIYGFPLPPTSEWDEHPVLAMEGSYMEEMLKEEFPGWPIEHFMHGEVNGGYPDHFLGIGLGLVKDFTRGGDAQPIDMRAMSVTMTLWAPRLVIAAKRLGVDPETIRVYLLGSRT